mmetsp:Transcript_180/g.556  ORF Transcript_180/g.556 Transcript_180/m.556 type:complete len:120 (-) Transcript_180:1349-1708(-)
MSTGCALLMNGKPRYCRVLRGKLLFFASADPRERERDAERVDLTLPGVLVRQTGPGTIDVHTPTVTLSLSLDASMTPSLFASLQSCTLVGVDNATIDLADELIAEGVRQNRERQRSHNA